MKPPLWAAPAMVALAGCREEQSALHPRGSDAADIATLAWVMFVCGTAILALVMIATGVAICGGAKLRARLASRGFVIGFGIAFPIVVLTALLGWGLWLMRGTAQSFHRPAAHRIHVAGEQWWWRVTYADADVASANEVRIPVGREVEFVLTSPDVIHSFWIPSLGGKADMIPGRTTRLRLTATQAGTYRGQCAEYCGGPHALMALPVIAMPPAAFDAWLTAQAGPSPEPATADGRAVFDAAGCGSCHTIRGTAAAGRIGPDLSRIGSRASVGVDTEPMSRDALARFIAAPHRTKPGVLMPPFEMLSPETRLALADYLLSLR